MYFYAKTQRHLLPPLWIDWPAQARGLTVFPIFRGGFRFLPQIRFSGSEIVRGATIVRERPVPTVPSLDISNTGDRPVLVVRGQLLNGGRQNRIANASACILGGQSIPLPVCCIERSRWEGDGRFRRGDTIAPHTQITTLSGSIADSIAGGAPSFHADQTMVWRSVNETLADCGATSSTHSVTAVFEKPPTQLAELLDAFPPPRWASGLAIAVGQQIASVQVFPNPEVCSALWRAAVASCAILPRCREAKGSIDRSVVRNFLHDINRSIWIRVNPIGAGETWLVDHQRSYASVVVHQDALLHASVVSQLAT